MHGLAWDHAYHGRKNMLVSLYELLKCVDAHGQAVSAGAIAALEELLLGSTTNTGSGGGGNDLAVDIIALLARFVEQPTGARCGGKLGAGDSAGRILGESASRSAKGHYASLLASVF